MSENILFFVSAGNDGKNIDKSKVFPASLELENILVISSSDISGDLAHGSNFGKKTVDFLNFNFECLVNYKFTHFLYIFEILN